MDHRLVPGYADLTASAMSAADVCNGSKADTRPLAAGMGGKQKLRHLMVAGDGTDFECGTFSVLVPLRILYLCVSRR